ncbi:MAG: MFS transporter [Pseudomonadota bacterium]
MFLRKRPKIPPAAPAEARPDGTDWASVFAVTLGITAFSTAQGLTYPLFSFLLDDRGASDGMVGLHAASFMLGLGVSVAILPVLNRILRARHLILAGLLIAVACLVGFAVIDDLFVWFLLRFMLGFCVNTIYVLGEAWLNAAATDDKRGRVAGIYGAGMAGGFAVGPLGIPLFGTGGGLAFAVCAAIVAAVAFVFTALLRRTRVEPGVVVLGQIFSFFRLAPLMVLIVIVYGVLDTTAIAILPLYLTSGGLSQDIAAVFVVVLSAGMVMSQPGVGLLLDRFDRWSVAIGCLVVTGLSLVAMLYLPIEGWLLWPVAAVLGAAYFGLYTSALALLGQEYGGGTLVAGSAAFALAYAVGGLIGPAATGTLMSVSVPGAFWFLIVICVGTAVVTLRHRSV